MTAPAEAVRLTECPVCGDVILLARIQGLAVRLGRWAPPRSHARVLHRYGLAVLCLVKTGRFVYATEFDPTSNTAVAATVHVCGIDPTNPR